MMWRDLDNFSSGSVCMVLASDYYDKEDYIRNYDEFLTLVSWIAMKIPFLDLKAPHEELRKEMREAFERVLHSGWYVRGNEVTQLENEFSNYAGTQLSVAYNDMRTPESILQPKARALSNSILSIPIGPHLKLSDADIVIQVLRSHLDAGV